MNTFTITKDNGITKISAKAKTDVNTIIINALAEAYGAENVKMVRVGTSTETNAIGVRVGELVENGFSYDLCLTVDSTVKSHKEKITKRYTVPAFDFDSAVERYEDYIAEQELKAIKRSLKKSTSKKSAKDAEKAEREKEVKEAIQKVKEKNKEKESKN